MGPPKYAKLPRTPRILEHHRSSQKAQKSPETQSAQELQRIPQKKQETQQTHGTIVISRAPRISQNPRGPQNAMEYETPANPWVPQNLTNSRKCQVSQESQGPFGTPKTQESQLSEESQLCQESEGTLKSLDPPGIYNPWNAKRPMNPGIPRIYRKSHYPRAPKQSGTSEDP